MVDWDSDSPILTKNLTRVLQHIKHKAQEKIRPSVEDIRYWQKETMHGLAPPHKDYVGGFRGENGALKDCNVRVNNVYGTPPGQVAKDLQLFEERLHLAMSKLDVSFKDPIDEDHFEAVLVIAAWAHAEWVRIHPFANGNGRSARLLTNYILMYYGLPPVMKLRPRPDGGYSLAAAQAMLGNSKPTLNFLKEMFNTYLKD